MNKYPVWKYVLIVLALVVSTIYAAPNLFGEVPVVQVSGARASNKVDAVMQSGLEQAVKAAGIPIAGVESADGQATFRFADTDTQIKARDALAAKVPPGYVVALNLQSNTPRWLQALGAKPMYLGLDLRGGVHFLLQVDIAEFGSPLGPNVTGAAPAIMQVPRVYWESLWQFSYLILTAPFSPDDGGVFGDARHAAGGARCP